MITFLNRYKITIAGLTVILTSWVGVWHLFHDSSASFGYCIFPVFILTIFLTGVGSFLIAEDITPGWLP